MVDCFQGRALLLSLTELSGTRLESRFFVNSDSPGMLVLFWDLLCSPAQQLVLSFGGAILLLCCYFDLAPCPALLAPCYGDILLVK